jgi:hypothetical protein
LRDEACQYLGRDTASKGEEDQREGGCEHVAVIILVARDGVVEKFVERKEKRK